MTPPNNDQISVHSKMLDAILLIVVFGFIFGAVIYLYYILMGAVAGIIMALIIVLFNLIVWSPMLKEKWEKTWVMVNTFDD